MAPGVPPVTEIDVLVPVHIVVSPVIVAEGKLPVTLMLFTFISGLVPVAVPA